MSRPPATRNTRLFHRHDGFDWAIVVQRDGKVTVRQKHARESRAHTISMSDIIDMARGVNLLIPRAAVTSSPPPVSAERVEFERKERARAFGAGLKRIVAASQPKAVQQEFI